MFAHGGADGMRQGGGALRVTLMAVESTQLVPVNDDDKPVLANLLQFYCYEFAAIRQYDVTDHGLYVYRYLYHYFVESGRDAYFIRRAARNDYQPELEGSRGGRFGHAGYATRSVRARRARNGDSGAPGDEFSPRRTS